MLRRAIAVAAALAAVLLSAAPAAGAEWLAGDLHVHSCYSHDAYCPDTDEPIEYEPGDDPSNLQEQLAGHIEANGESIYTYGVHVRDRFTEAAARGLHFLAITDHDDVRSVSDPGFGTSGVIGLPGYENSIRGHAQVLGARKIYDDGGGAPEAVQRMIEELHADGGAFQANHPGYRFDKPFSSCGDTTPLHWRYGFDVQPDTIEAWNPTSSIAAAESYLECWLSRGERMGITGGSDGHWASTQAVGAGHPTTWVLARERSLAAILAALRAGRTAISDNPPSLGGRPLLLEGDADRDGRFEATIGDTVPPGAPMRVRSDGAAVGLVRVRANGQTLVDAPLGAGGEVRFAAPAQPGWVRAILRAGDENTEEAPGCEPPAEFISDCAYDHASMQGMTSPLYVAHPPVVVPPPRGQTPRPRPRPANAPPRRGGSHPAPGRPGKRAGQRIATPQLRVFFRRPRVRARTLRRRRVARVWVRCSLPCRAVVALYARGRRVGRGRARLPGPRARPVRVRLNRRSIRRLPGRTRFRARVQAWTLGRY